MAEPAYTFSSLIDKNSAKRARVTAHGISSITTTPEQNQYLFKSVGNGTTAKGQPKIFINTKVGAAPLNVEEVGTIKHEVASNPRYNYANLSSKSSRFVPPKWLVVRKKERNVPPYTYKVVGA